MNDPLSTQANAATAEAAITAQLAPGVAWWDPETDDRLVCRHVRQETHDVRTFILEAPGPRLFRWRPGQFMTFELEVGGRKINRCYTISASAARPHRLAITVKRVAGGPVSNWLHDHLRPGSVIEAMGPMGSFTALDAPAEKYLFLSGGSGITPLMSMARTYADLGLPRDIVFAHHARTPGDIVFRRELEAMAAVEPTFRFVPVCEADAPFERWHGLRGRISAEALSLIAPDLLEREIFTCGPAPYMAAVRAILEARGYPMARYHEESFDFAALAPEEAASARAAERAMAEEPEPAPTVATFKVQLTRSRRSFEMPADQFVLAAARKAGITLPSSCTQGMCGTCKCKLVSGQVEMNHKGGIRQREIDQGLVLLCCSRPLTDLVVER